MNTNNSNTCEYELDGGFLALSSADDNKGQLVLSLTNKLSEAEAEENSKTVREREMYFELMYF